MSEKYPKEIESFHNALASLPGVTDVCSGITDLSTLTSDTLSGVEVAHLPHGALIRTDGGLEGEALIQFEFRLAPTIESWSTLEFLAWFVRDQARSGVPLQLRPFGLPPKTGKKLHTGDTLKFHIDFFCLQMEEDLGPALDHIQQLTKHLKMALSLYR